MRIIFLRLSIITLVMQSSFLYLHAQSVDLRTVGTAVPFLRISPDAKSAGMANVGIATTPGVNASFYNNAKSVFNTEKGDVNVNYMPWMQSEGFKDVYLATMAGYYKPDELSAVTASLRYFSSGNIQFQDMSGAKLGAYRPREMAFNLGYARKLSQKLSIGVALSYINSNLAGGQTIDGTSYGSAGAVAGDISLYYSGAAADKSGFSAGVAITNLGGKMSYSSDAGQEDYLPANLGIGVAYTKVLDSRNKIQFAVDANKLMVPTPPDANSADYPAKLARYRNKGVSGSWFSSFGDAPDGFKEELKEVLLGGALEYTYDDLFMVRAGYLYESESKGGRKGLTTGVGLKLNRFTAQFAYVVPAGSGIDRNPLSNNLSFGLAFRFK